MCVKYKMEMMQGPKASSLGKKTPPIYVKIIARLTKCQTREIAVTNVLSKDLGKKEKEEEKNSQAYAM